MSVSIITCPSCGRLLLNDTVQCPTCNHVLDEERHKVFPTVDFSYSGEEEVECRICHVQVRSGLVRCWNCGSIMREDIEEKYRQMRSAPSPVIYSQKEDRQRELERIKLATADGEISESDDVEADDEDFDLAPEVAKAMLDQATLPSTRTDAPSDGQPSANTGAPTAEPPMRPVPPTQPTPAAVKPEGDTFNLQTEPAKTAEAAAPQDSAPAAAAEKTAAEPVAETPPEKSPEGDQPATKPKQTPADDENQIPHSEATGGDVLLQVALQEQKESEQRRKSGGRRRPKRPDSSEPGLIVYCANGCRIKVAERHRGKVGKCPRCSALFIVPNKSVDEQKAEIAAAKTAATQSEEAGPKEYSAGKFTHWMTDLHSHSVDPKKLKLVPGSLEKAFTSVDVAFADDGLLLLTLAKPGMFGKIDPTKLEQAREEVLAFLRGEPSEAVKTKMKKAREAEGKKRAAEAAKKEAEAKKAAAKAKKEKEKAKKGKKGKDAPPPAPTVEAAASETKPPEPKVEDPFEFLPAVEFDAIPAELVRQISVVQPVMYEHESMFAGVPVFGMGRIAVLIPTATPEATKRCLSLTLTEFRRLQTILEEQFGVTDLIDGLDIPLNDNLQPVTCHYTEQSFGKLDQSQYYLADPACQLTIVGRQCQNCGLVVSEDARKKEKIGGANGKGIAKAKCPKCGDKFGEITLYSMANQKPVEVSDEATSDAEATTDTDSAGSPGLDPPV